MSVDVIFPLLLHLNALYSRLIHQCFYCVIGLRLHSFLSYQRHFWPYNPVLTCVLNCLCKLYVHFSMCENK